jgi:hypothetical protein
VPVPSIGGGHRRSKAVVIMTGCPVGVRWQRIPVPQGADTEKPGAPTVVENGSVIPDQPTTTPIPRLPTGDLLHANPPDPSGRQVRHTDHP